ncbi:MAG: hypothetical protein ABIG63_16835 [Chloroflexota bacterium]
MPVKTLDEPAYIIIDNCVLSMLMEWYCTDLWYCAENRRLSAQQKLEKAQEWLTTQLDLVRANAVDEFLHTTSHVSEEFQPEKGTLGGKGLRTHQIRTIRNQIREQFQQFVPEDRYIQALRTLPNANKRLVHPKEGLSDPDLSLICLGLELTQYGKPVIILSNDQDLLDFAAWVRTKKSLFDAPINTGLLESETGLGYMELIHRGCQITTEQMTLLINFMIKDTVNRMQKKDDGTQLNPQKAAKIYNKVTEINALFVQAVSIKA